MCFLRPGAYRLMGGPVLEVEGLGQTLGRATRGSSRRGGRSPNQVRADDLELQVDSLWAPREAESQPGTDPSPGLAQEWLGPTAPRGPFPDTLHCQDPKPEIFVRARPNQAGVDCPANRRELSLEPVTVYLEKSKKSDVSCT